MYLALSFKGQWEWVSGFIAQNNSISGDKIEIGDLENGRTTLFIAYSKFPSNLVSPLSAIMTKEKFYQEVNNLVEDYIHNNNSKANFLLINSKTLQNSFDQYDIFVGLMIVLSNDLFEDELVVY